MAGIEAFDPKVLNLNLDDALYFLLTTEGSRAQDPRFLKLKDYLQARVKKELKVDVSELLREHEAELDKIIELYD